jgi:hypothetical protein
MWIPYKLTDGMVKWLDLGDRRMIDPFFDETIQICRCKQKERSSLQSLSSAEFLIEAGKGLDALTPGAFIFHVSRCGSTLLSQVFSQPEENIAIAEAPLLDEILQVGDASLFKSAVALMGQKRNFKETDYIIKLDSWHIHHYATLREWYPVTPFFFLYRRPDEVIASHAKRRGIHAVPGMLSHSLLKTDAPETFGGDFNRYTAQVLTQYFIQLQSIFGLHHPKNLLFDYASGGKSMVAAFSEFTGVQMRDITRLDYHSKSTQEVFKPEEPVDKKFFFEDCHAAYEQLRTLHL